MLTTEALFRYIYTLVDDAMKLSPHRRPGPAALIPNSQLVTMYLLQAMKGVLSDSHWLRLMETEYRFFTHLPERSRYLQAPSSPRRMGGDVPSEPGAPAVARR